MSASFANVQVRGDDREQVAEVVAALVEQTGYDLEPEIYGGDRSVYIGPAIDGWIGVYDSACDGVAVGPLAWLARGLSAHLGAVTLAWMVHDSALLLYVLFQDGEVVDRYVSRPDYFRPASAEAPRRPVGPLGGDGERLLETAGTPGDAALVTRLLAAPGPFARATLQRIAATLGQRHADLGHADIEDDQLAEAPLERLDDFDRLEFVTREPDAADGDR